MYHKNMYQLVVKPPQKKSPPPLPPSLSCLELLAGHGADGGDFFEKRIFPSPRKHQSKEEQPARWKTITLQVDAASKFHTQYGCAPLAEAGRVRVEPELRARAIRALEDRRFDEQVNAAQLLSERARAEEKERRRRERELQLMAGDFATVFAQSVVLRSSSTARALLRAASDGVQSMEDVAVASASGDGCGGGGSLRALDLELRSALLQLFKVEEKAIRWWPTAARCYAEWLGAQIDSAARRHTTVGDAFA